MSVRQKFQATLALVFYLLLLTALLPLLPLRLLWRSRRAPAYRRRMPERFGFGLPRPRAGGVWVHAVSVGETFAAAPTVRSLLQRHPARSITVTTTTPTGSAQVQSLFGDKVAHSYAPYDWPLFVWLFLRRVRPDLLIVMETEIWPVTILLCQALGIDVLLANARLSEKSANGYRKVSWLIRPCLAHCQVAAQHADDALRLQSLGARAQNTCVTGSVKFDIAVDEALRVRAQEMKKLLVARECGPVWIAASTHEGEEKAALHVHRQVLQQYADALLVLVPRHPERFDSVARECERDGFTLARRSAYSAVESCLQQDAQVLLVDSLGELMLFYGVADVAFVGGSLVNVGGHNYLEPASWGIPVISGPHRHNFANIARQLVEVGALQLVDDADGLASAVLALLGDGDGRAQCGAAGLGLLAANRGASAKLLEQIETLLEAKPVASLAAKPASKAQTKP